MFYMGQFAHILLMYACFHAHVDKDAEYAKGAMCGLEVLSGVVTFRCVADRPSQPEVKVFDGLGRRPNIVHIAP